MITLAPLVQSPDRAGTGLRILAVGAHADDIEIGAGGTLLTLLDAGEIARLDWLVLSAEGERHAEAAESASRCLELVPDSSLTIAELPERHFHASVGLLKSTVGGVVAASNPDIVIGPALHDVHQDHRATAEALQQACRDHFVLQYEIVKFEGDLRTPNVYSPIEDDVMTRKIAWLHESFPSQRSRQWFDDEMFRGIARVRGVESVSRYAEGFHCRKLVFGGSNGNKKVES